MQSRSSVSIDRLLGRGLFEREGGPEPTLIPHLALFGQIESFDRVCDYAKLFARGIGVPHIPWPDLENATVSAFVSRLDSFSEIEPLLKAHASVATFLPDSMLQDAARLLHDFEDQDKYRSTERLARLVARKPDLLDGALLEEARAAILGERHSDEAATLPWVAITLLGRERDALIEQLAEPTDFNVGSLGALMPHLSDDEQIRLVASFRQTPMISDYPAPALALQTHLLPSARGEAQLRLLEGASAAATQFITADDYLPDWMLALIVSRLAHSPIKQASGVARLLLKMLPEPWSKQIASRFAWPDLSFSFADVLLVQPGSEYLVEDKAAIAELREIAEETLDGIITRWGGSPPATGLEQQQQQQQQQQGGDSVVLSAPATAKSEGFFDLIGKGMRRAREVFAGRGDEETASAPPPQDEPPPDTAPRDTNGGSDDVPPRDVYALLICPITVKPMVEFGVTVGLSNKPTPGVTGGTFSAPDLDVAPYKLVITLVSDGFLLRVGEANVATLDVTAADPYPSTDIHLRAVAYDEFDADRSLMAHYSIDGQLIGSATRIIKVSEKDAADATGGVVKGFDFSMPPGVPTPDMTIAIVKGNTVDQGTLIWNILTPHTDIDVTLPADETKYKSNIGSQPEVWARKLMNDVNANPAHEELEPLMVGCGKEVREQMPVWPRRKLLELWQKFKGSSERPTILIVSDEPHIPWELAYLRVDLDDGTEGFLGAEFVVGRWVRGYEDVTGSFVPAYPPPTAVTVKSMAVVTGDYSQTRNWNKLEGAEKEATDLIASYRATKVNADNQLATWLKDQADVDLIHFAVHGNWSLTGNKDGVVLIDGTTLTPTKVRAANLSRKPFIFLNACQLGQGDETLGDYGGIAAAFLKAGAAGVVASLWNVDDEEARKLAVEFYRQVKSTNDTPGELLRKERSTYQQDTKSKLSLAYQFFGHPHLRMKINLP